MRAAQPLRGQIRVDRRGSGGHSRNTAAPCRAGARARAGTGRSGGAGSWGSHVDPFSQRPYAGGNPVDRLADDARARSAAFSLRAPRRPGRGGRARARGSPIPGSAASSPITWRSIRYSTAQGWHDAADRRARAADARSRPCAVLHYAQEIFEGLKAYRLDDGGVALFRPRRQRRAASAARRGAWRCPNCPRSCSSARWRRWSRADRDWIPTADGGSLYLRPFMIASEAFLGVKPGERVSLHGDRLVGRRLLEGRRARDLAVGQPRLHPRRARRHRRGQVRRQLRHQPGRAGARRSRRGCDQVVFLDAAERRWVEELGGMNIFFVIDDGSLRTPPLTRHDPARHHPRFADPARPRRGADGARGALCDRPVARRCRERRGWSRASPAAPRRW